MDIKNKIKIGCDYYEVEFEERPMQDNELCRGFCDTANRRIVLKKDLSDTRLMETFLHECLHAVDDIYRLSINETQVNILGIGILNLIRENNINFLK